MLSSHYSATPTLSESTPFLFVKINPPQFRTLVDRIVSESAEVFAMRGFSRFIANLQQTWSSLDDENDHSLRFVLSEGGDLYFGREGYAGRTGKIPAHRQLAANRLCHTCQSAGILYFNDKGKIAKVSASSGDFRPHVQSLQYALAALIRQDVQFADEFQIEEVRVGEGKKEFVSRPLSFTALCHQLESLGHSLKSRPQVSLSPAKVNHDNSRLKRERMNDESPLNGPELSSRTPSALSGGVSSSLFVGEKKVRRTLFGDGAGNDKITSPSFRE